MKIIESAVSETNIVANDGTTRPRATLKSSWIPGTIALRSMTGTVSNVAVMENAYTFRVSSGRTFDIPVVVFVDETTRNAWAGRKADFYIETGSGIVGVTLSSSNVLRWDSSLISKSKAGETLEQLVNRFETEFDHLQLAQPSMGGTELEYAVATAVGPWFFAKSIGSFVHAPATIKNITVSDGQLQLDLDSATGNFSTVTVWVDMETRQVTIVTANGHLIFPK
jgi:hypothetical protein